MGERLHVSFKEEEEELYEWVVKQKEDGNFRSKSGVVIAALRDMKDEMDEEGMLT